MSYAAAYPTQAPPPPTPTDSPRRPATVQLAAGLLLVMAFVGLVYAVVTLTVTPGVLDRFRSGAGQASSSDIDGYVTVVWTFAALGTVLAVVLFALYIVLALALRRGSSGARVATWVVCGLGMLFGCGSGIAVGAQRSGPSTPGTLGFALSEAYPESWISLNVGLAIAQTVGYLVVALLLVLGPRAFFRKGDDPAARPQSYVALPTYGSANTYAANPGAPAAAPGSGVPAATGYPGHDPAAAFPGAPTFPAGQGAPPQAAPAFPPQPTSAFPPQPTSAFPPAAGQAFPAGQGAPPQAGAAPAFPAGPGMPPQAAAGPPYPGGPAPSAEDHAFWSRPAPTPPSAAPAPPNAASAPPAPPNVAPAPPAPAASAPFVAAPASAAPAGQDLPPGGRPASEDAWSEGTATIPTAASSPTPLAPPYAEPTQAASSAPASTHPATPRPESDSDGTSTSDGTPTGRSSD
ncbi:hypothetical protein [Actinoplanes sp. NBRC 103695]|uniref:hypothetical protein n=1 Tax=Actinoplanes sp. NBRC 103695 TaxID=3032202 RepID=UPI002557BB4D|nr:hypothetical protein [Actinoplanes sp. NBRC 103695]GLY99280.1 hypothetical protein Acsp02_65330 [Actinoplanes sp. NBRC 103695]